VAAVLLMVPPKVNTQILRSMVIEDQDTFVSSFLAMHLMHLASCASIRG
jgi:hypothetical protein